MRILLIRHGQPHIALRPRTGHAGFAEYIAAYEEAGLSPANLPPQELQDLARALDHVFTSSLPRSYQSAAALAPHAEQIADPLFVEAPLAAPVIPLLRMRVSKWAVLSRLLWYVGFHPGIESPRRAAARAAQAADILIARARKSGITAVVAHGYFNWMIGRQLVRRGFARKGSHRAQYWNTVIYERADGDDPDPS
jgi:broad specificity phosphatase PhoE